MSKLKDNSPQIPQEDLKAAAAAGEKAKFAELTPEDLKSQAETPVLEAVDSELAAANLGSSAGDASHNLMPQRKKGSYLKEFTKGILKQNPLLVLLLGTCPALAVTTSLMNGLGMGLASTFVLLCSNVVISLLRNIIPEKVRIPCFITVIASFVTILQFLLQAYVPSLTDSLGIFLPLITVNCIILGRAEAFASKNPVGLSALDGLGMGLGFTAALCLIGGIREILGNGSIAGWQIPFIGGENTLQPLLIFIMPPGGFIIFGLVIAIALKLTDVFYAKHPDEAMTAKAVRNTACTGCTQSGSCPSAQAVTADPPVQDGGKK